MSKKAAVTLQKEQLIIPGLGSRNTGLDSLRGIFAIMVFFSHLELMKFYSGLDNLMHKDIVYQLGRIGVTGFFVLSGFLITVHLLQLKEREGSVIKKIKSFYTKRILRIWPLYYAIILLSLFVFPHIDALHFTIPSHGMDARTQPFSFQLYYLFLLPQVPLSYHYILPFAEPSWSIGVEEIFYLIIPVVIFNTKRLQTILIAVCILFVVWRGWAYVEPVDNTVDFITNFLISSRYDCISIGCIAGLYFYQKKSFLQFINKKAVFAITIALLIILCLGTPQSVYQYAHFAILFAVIILYTAMNTQSILNNNLLQFYGKISFSLYMTHEIAIMLLLNAHDFSDYHPALLYIVSFIAASVLAFITYKLIEEPFLKIKNNIA